MPAEHLPNLADECFFIAPIGDEGSDVRDRSDGVMEYIVAPAAKEHELETVRADKIAKPGQITRQVIEHVVGAKAAVVDLTGANPARTTPSGPPATSHADWAATTTPAHDHTP
jgi:hypothetical protein